MDIERDRCLEAEEEKRILNVIRGHHEAKNKQRTLELTDRNAYEIFFFINFRNSDAYASALSNPKIDLVNRTIFFDKTKNGNKRQVPLSKPAISLLANADLSVHKNGEFFVALDQAI